MAAPSVTASDASSAMRPPVVREPLSTGSRGRFNASSTLYFARRSRRGRRGGAGGVQARGAVCPPPADRGEGGDDDGDEDPPQPHADALPRPVEAGHPPGDVAAEEVADGQHDEQRDRCRAARRRLAYLREGGERWACGEATIAQEHFASNFLEGWMHTMARGWNRSGPRRAVLACVPGERRALGLMAFGLALHDLGWRITYLGADAPLPGVEHAAAAVGADVVVLSAALPTTLASQVDALRALSRRHAVAVGGAGAAANRSEWLASRTLPADPIIAAHALTTHQELAPRSTAENRHAPVT